MTEDFPKLPRGFRWKVWQYRYEGSPKLRVSVVDIFGRSRASARSWLSDDELAGDDLRNEIVRLAEEAHCEFQANRRVADKSVVREMQRRLNKKELT